MRVLYLTPWYPSERDAMLGLFVQKHVECVRAQGVDVRVIFSNSLNSTWRQWRQLRYKRQATCEIKSDHCKKIALPNAGGIFL